MKEKFAKLLFWLALFLMAFSFLMLARKQEPFYTHFYLFVWWSYIGLLDSWLYWKGGESLFWEKPLDFLTFLLPFSAFLWFVFEAFNLRIQNWHYVNVASELWIRWPATFLAFGTVLPGIFLTSNFLDYLGIFKRNEFSQFFPFTISRTIFFSLLSLGAIMLALPLISPIYFFPLLWGGFVLLLDPINAQWGGKSLLNEWKQRNWNRTLQLLFSGLICGGLWEFWNFWAGAKWVYSVPLPESLLKELKIFEMPILGFLGFPPFALECFVMTEFVNNLRERITERQWKMVSIFALLFALLMCWLIDQHTIKSFR